MKVASKYFSLLFLGFFLGESPTLFATPSLLTQTDSDEYKLQLRYTPSPTPISEIDTYDPDSLGSYRIYLSFGKPRFNKHLKFYEQLYGSAAVYPTLGVNQYFYHNRYAALGIGANISFYTATGYAAEKDSIPTNPSVSTRLKKTTSATALTLVPYQIYLAASLSPFPKKKVVFDVWAGYEELYFQEVRVVDLSNTSTSSSTVTTSTTATNTSTTTPTTTSTTAATDTTVGAPTSSTSTSANATNSGPTTLDTGWNSSFTFGFAVNICLNQIEDRDIRASSKGIGMNAIYLTPFYQYTQRLEFDKLLISRRKRSPVDFSRQTIGLAFTFELE